MVCENDVVNPESSEDRHLLEAVRRMAKDMNLKGPAVADAAAPPGAVEALEGWLARDYHGEMHYMARLGGDRADPAHWAPWARSVALFADSYDDGRPCSTDPADAAISRYARGRDYHDVLRDKLQHFKDLLTGSGRPALICVDISPLMEKALAARGGLGWVGKNGNLLRRDSGSFFFLGGLVTDAVWPEDEPAEDLCGTCDLCLSACPTGAIVAPGVVDARRCIAYLTIELKGAIPRALRPALGNRIFGCDDCQEVCPVNAPRTGADPAYASPLPPSTLLELATLDQEGFRQRFRRTPLWRTRWRGLLRNIMVALGNWGSPAAATALREALDHPEPLVRQHAAWGLSRTSSEQAGHWLQQRALAEENEEVQAEIQLCLEEWNER
jgi:epoxyqueuosine reductase